MKNNLPTIEDSYNILALKKDSLWDKYITKASIEEWLNNFKGEIFNQEYEHQLALWLLANFVYYNEKEVRHFCKDLYKRFLHYMARYYQIVGLNLDISLERIFNYSRFYPLGIPSESGAFVLYYFRQENNLPIGAFSKNSILQEESFEYLDNIIIIDDVTVTGDQAISYLKKFLELKLEKNIILLTFLSTKKAVDELNMHNIKVISCNTLDDRCQCFSDESSIFFHYKNHMNNCRQMATFYGNKLMPTKPLGYKNGQYTFGFFYNIPDNTLPIFWADNNNWTPIFKRYDKKYTKEVLYNDIGRFI